MDSSNKAILSRIFESKLFLAATSVPVTWSNSWKKPFPAGAVDLKGMIWGAGPQTPG